MQREWFDPQLQDYCIRRAWRCHQVSASAKEITEKGRACIGERENSLGPIIQDAKGGNEDRFKEVSAAYDVLGDETKRNEYDEARRLGPSAMGGFASGQDGFNVHFEDFDDLGGMFGNLFGRGQRGPVPMRGVDQETRIHLGFRDAIDGITTNVAFGESGSGGRAHAKVKIPPGVDNGQRIASLGRVELAATEARMGIYMLWLK